ncbi:MAG: hypothetical protein LHV68_05980 [Elusimicrobia bacterium]|nr:hypothetical protein [Candidatus Liberimonas magnetica]
MAYKDESILEEEKKFGVLEGFEVAATTAAGIGAGLVVAAVSVAALASAELVLPALLCLKASGVLGGGAGFIFGVRMTKKRKSK